jgi:hypothetical protein
VCGLWKITMNGSLRSVSNLNLILMFDYDVILLPLFCNVIDCDQ